MGAEFRLAGQGVREANADSRKAAENRRPHHREPGSGDWDVAEITATVDDYLSMLEAELAGEPCSKAAHRRALLLRLNPVGAGNPVTVADLGIFP